MVFSDPDHYPTYTLGSDDVFYGVKYDIHGEVIDISQGFIWTTSDPDIVEVDHTTFTDSTNIYCNGEGQAIITIDDDEGHVNTTLVTVTHGGDVVDSIVIRDAPGGGGSWVGARKYDLGGHDTFYAAGYNSSSGSYLGDVEVKWTINNPEVGIINPPMGYLTDFDAMGPGTCFITAEYNMGIINRTGILSVGEVDEIIIRNAPDDGGDPVSDELLYIDEDIRLWAAGYNHSYGYLYDVNVIWISTDPDVGTVTSPGTNTHFQPTGPGMCDVIANYEEKMIINSCTITVWVHDVDYITIRDSPSGGGLPVGDMFYGVDGGDIFFATGYNYTDGYIGDVEVIWTSDDPDVGTVDPQIGTFTHFETIGGGNCVVTADYNGLITNSTGDLIVVAVDEIIIRDEPDNGGLPVSDISIYVEDDDQFWAAGYNETYGYLGDVSVIWTCSNTSVASVTSPGHSTNFYPSAVGTCSVLAYYSGGIMNTTGNITIWTYEVEFIMIRDAPGGGGSPVGDMAYELRENDVFFAASYNLSIGYMADVEVTWMSSNLSVGTINTFGSSTNFTAIEGGTCFVTADFGLGISNSTGILTVYSLYNITVDVDGGAHYSSIQEAIDNANDGDTIFVYNGTYKEHLTIDKFITLIGENKKSTIIDGGNNKIAVYISGDNVSLSHFGIHNAEYGIYCNGSDFTYITHNRIENYVYGIFNNRTTNGHFAHNTITNGLYGIFTYEASDDAIRYNTISYNTMYGAKDYKSQLKNCFNWNYFHHNHIAYCYDPDTHISTLEFDGNILLDNHIGIMIENASTISVTNNALSRNEYGIYLVNASPNIAHNHISSGNSGVYAEQSSPSISNNVISNISDYGIYAKSGDSLKIINNTLINANMVFLNCTIKELWLKNSNITKINTTIEDYHPDATSSLEIRWFLRLRVVDEEGEPIENATVLIYDAYDSFISAHITDPEGWIEWIIIIDSLQNSTSNITYNPYRIFVVKDSLTNTTMLTIDENKAVTISLEVDEGLTVASNPSFPWAFVIVVGFIGAIGIGGLLIEVMKYGLLTLFLPLYSRIKKEKMLDQPTRYKIYGYIIGNPGANYGLIKQDLGIPNGQLVHHLRQLTHAHLIYSTEDGIRKRFYPVDFPKPKKGEHYFTHLQEKILRLIKENSGISQKRIASSTGISRQVASYHLTKMEQIGVIRKELVGRHNRYYVSET